MKKIQVAALVAAIAVVGALAASAANTKRQPICRGTAQTMTLIPFTSPSDLSTSQHLAPSVAEQMVERAADTCGVIGGAVATARVESDLAPAFLALRPAVAKAPNRKPYIAEMESRGMAFLRGRVLDPLAGAHAEPTSPFLGALVKLGEEYRGQGYSGGLIVLVGDLIDVEEAPNGGTVDFRSNRLDQAALASFVPALKALAGACVIDVGAEASSRLDPRLLRAARASMGRVLREAGVGFTAVARDLPASCAS